MSRRQTVLYTTLFDGDMKNDAVITAGLCGITENVRVQVRSLVHAGIASAKGRWSILVLKPEEVARLAIELLKKVPVDWLLNDPKFSESVEEIKRLGKMLSVKEKS